MKRPLLPMFLLLALVVCLASLYSFRYRRHGFNMLWYGHEWCTASTVIFARNWYREGAWRLGFMQLWNPASIEFASVADRQPYFSAPPGAVLPVYLIATLAHAEPNVAMVMGYNVAAHALAAFAVAVTTLVLLVRNRFPAWSAAIFAAVAAGLFTLMPGPQYWLQNVYYSDQAVLLPFVLFVMLEVARDESPAASLAVMQGLVLCWGCYTDWFMWFGAAAVFVKRLACGQILLRTRAGWRATFIFWSPAALAVAVFAAQLQAFGLLPLLAERAFMYTGASDAVPLSLVCFSKVFWLQHVQRFYGWFTIPLLAWAAATACVLMLAVLVQRWRAKPLAAGVRDACGLLWTVSVPALAYVYVFRNYAAAHEYATLKLALTLTIAATAVTPVLLAAVWRRVVALNVTDRWLWLSRVLNAGALLVLLLTVSAGAQAYLKERRRVAGMYMGPRACNPFIDVGQFVARNTRIDDVVVSPHFEIPTKPPQWLCYSMKRVYQTPTLFDVYSRVHACGGRARTVSVLLTNTAPAVLAPLAPLFECATTSIVASTFALYKVPVTAVTRMVESTAWQRVSHLRQLHTRFGQTNGLSVVYLADLHSLSATNLHTGRYGLFQRGQSHRGETLHVWGFDCAKALTAHAPVRGIGWLHIPLQPSYRSFRTILAINNPAASVTFSIDVDGSNVFRSAEVTSSTPPIFVEVVVAGKHDLVLRLAPGINNAGDEAVWVDPHFTRVPAQEVRVR